MHSEQITTHQFMRLEIINMTLDQSLDNTTEIPFLFHLPADLAGSFESEDVSIRYMLQRFVLFFYNGCVLLFSYTYHSKVLFENDKAPLVTERAMAAYANYAMVRELHQPVIEKQDHAFVHLSRSVWMAGAPIYVTVHLDNIKAFTASLLYSFLKRIILTLSKYRLIVSNWILYVDKSYPVNMKIQ